MKKINLITSLSPEKQYEIRRWFMITIALSIGIASVGGYYMIAAFLQYRGIKKEVALLRSQTSNYTANVNAKGALKKEYDDLHVRDTKMNAYKQQKKNPYAYVAEILQACAADIQLESMRFDKHTVEITILAPTMERAQAFGKQLSQTTLFVNTKIISLQQIEQTNQIRSIIKSTVLAK